MFFKRVNGFTFLICYKCGNNVSIQLYRNKEMPDMLEYRCDCGNKEFQDGISNEVYENCYICGKPLGDSKYLRCENCHNEVIKKEKFTPSREDFEQSHRNRLKVTSENYSGMEYEDIYIYEK